MTKMEVTIGQHLDQLNPPVTTILADVELFWTIRIGNCRNIPVALLYTTSTADFWEHYFDSIQTKTRISCSICWVLGHSSVGGFWIHRGWNSTLEAAFFSCPLLTLPLHFNQHSNEKQIVENWKVGWSEREKAGDENTIGREEIAKLVQEFMDQESIEVQNIRERAKQLG
ncbi:hypothetical protein Ddye_024927 [Dipteronia dyeriana]|uniref:Uncharacterized protein n=1 Tax=Dipteronia dyeriana TaxID=168575 RepID=A0AAD9TVT2_9ROSI|nr:hypothetical protein Ddye_024927 [Dipteronia dyeriana]